MKQAYSNIHQDLIDGCRENNRKAQTEIYRLYYKAMYNTSLRILNDEMEAEDVMQEAFLSAFEKIGTYSGEVSFGAWLKRIVVNRSLDVLKKRKLNFEDVDSLPDVGYEELTERHESGELIMEKIKTSIQELADGYRVILSLYLLEGYDHEEISEILSISSSTSRSQFARAKKKLVQLLN